VVGQRGRRYTPRGSLQDEGPQQHPWVDDRQFEPMRRMRASVLESTTIPARECVCPCPLHDNYSI
jgi:hypothetical protein